MAAVALKPPQRFAQGFDFLLGSGLLALGLVQNAKHLVDLIQHAFQFHLDMLDMFDGRAEIAGRPGRRVSSGSRLNNRRWPCVPVAAATPPASPSAPPAASTAERRAPRSLFGRCRLRPRSGRCTGRRRFLVIVWAHQFVPGFSFPGREMQWNKCGRGVNVEFSRMGLPRREYPP